MFYTAVETINESFLCRAVNVTIAHKKFCQFVRFENLVRFTKAAGESDHMEVGGVTVVPTLVDENDVAVGPDVRGHTGHLQLVV